VAGKRGIEALGDVRGKRVFVRVDFNVPLRKGADGKQEVADDYRIQMSLPTLKKLVGKGARVIVGSHCGRPEGGKIEPEFSMKPAADRLREVLGSPVKFVADIVGKDAQQAAETLKDGEVLVLENLRFEKGEKKGSEEFGKKLAALAQLYVNDAFGVSHRGDASVTVVPKLLPSCAGDLVKTEVEKLKPLRDGTAPRPFVVVLGGAKLADKIPVLEALIPKVDSVFIGGGMSYTFLKAMGKEIGKSRFEPEMLEKATQILERARERSRETGRELVLPRDHVVAGSPDDISKYQVCDKIPPDCMALDIGPATIHDFTVKLETVKTVFWNGPLGMFEKKPFHLGTHYIASFLAFSKDIKTVVGGGDSAAATRELGIEDQMDWVSTGGGASLEYVQGEALPGIDALPDA
jgi:phosphoglycerate kinase